MKRTILLFALIFLTAILRSQEFMTLRLSDTDTTGMVPGDKVYVAVIIEEASPNALIYGFNLAFWHDQSVITWDGTTGNPLPGISYQNPLFPLIAGAMFNVNPNSELVMLWGDGSTGAALSGVTLPLTIIEFVFTYHGGSCPLIWGEQTSVPGFDLTLINGCVGQCWETYEATLKLGSTDITGLMPGDTVKVSIILDDISPGAEVWESQFCFHFDPGVIDWTGTFDTINGWWTVIYIGDVMVVYGAPEFATPGITFIDINFIYLGGETDLTWASDYPTEMYDQNFDYFVLTLFDGCVCDLPDYDVTFHVTSDDEDLQGAIITIGNLWLETDENGLAIFSLSDGQYDYTVTKPGYADEEGSFTVAGAPVDIEVEMVECYDVTFNVIPADSTIIIINGDTLVSGETICLPNGMYSFTVSSPGYNPYGGMITVSGASLNIMIVLQPILYDVTFFINCCGEPVENCIITYQGQTVITNAAGLAILNLVAGFYSFEIGGVPVTFTVPDTTYVPVDICNEVTFHVTCEGQPLECATVTVDNNLVQITNNLGNAVFCLENGDYSFVVSKYGYENYSGSFTVDNAPLLLEIDLYFPQPYPVQFQITNLVCDNPFDGLFVVCFGDTVQPGGTIELENGSYTWEVILDGCGSLINGFVEVNFAAVTIEINIQWLPHATFHVMSALGGNLSGAEVSVDDDILFTNASGETSFCMTGGDHFYSITQEGYDTLVGSFTFPCEDTTITILMNPVSIFDKSFEVFLLYPNPSNGKFYLETQNLIAESIEITVMDLTGRQVYEEKAIVTGKQEIDLTVQEKGMYFLKLKSGDRIFVGKLLIR
jgi:hypothetical protein